MKKLLTAAIALMVGLMAGGCMADGPNDKYLRGGGEYTVHCGSGI